MLIFPTLSDVNNYVPNCLVCSKPMRFNLDGMLSSVASNKPRWGGGHDPLRLKLEMKDGILCSSHKNHIVQIEIIENKILEWHDLINRLSPGNVYMKKMCPTCHFKINTSYGRGNLKKRKLFPSLDTR